ncbi:MAG: serine/threonine protein kinase [Kofleriaceae bacterium]
MAVLANTPAGSRSRARSESSAVTNVLQLRSANQNHNQVPERFADYYVFERLGVGGMAEVHRAETRSIGGVRRPIALKRLLPHVGESFELVRSFVHEAQLASRLRHENIAQVYQLGRYEGTYYIAMELIEGPTLQQLMQQCAGAAGPISIPIAINILIQICDALDYAHSLCDDEGQSLRLVHRDVSPANVIVSNTGIVKLIDFGIAKAADSSIHTAAGVIKGKYAYLAPEYIRGELDARADLFGLGVISHELLTNRRLFLGETHAQTVNKLRTMHVQPPSRWNPDVSRDLDDIVMTALQRDPSLRWQCAAAMRTALTNVAKDIGIPVTGADVREWVTWAFTRKPNREPSQLVRVIGTLEPSGTHEVDLNDLLDGPANANQISEPIPVPIGVRADTQPAPVLPTITVRSESPAIVIDRPNRNVLRARRSPAPPRGMNVVVATPAPAVPATEAIVRDAGRGAPRTARGTLRSEIQEPIAPRHETPSRAPASARTRSRPPQERRRHRLPPPPPGSGDAIQVGDDLLISERVASPRLPNAPAPVIWPWVLLMLAAAAVAAGYFTWPWPWPLPML